MPSDRSLAYWQRVKWGEGLLLLVGFPLLFFPERLILITTLYLVLLAGLWLAPLVIIRHPLIPPTPHHVALLLFCIALCVSILVSADPALTLPKATGLILGLATWRYLVLAVGGRAQVKWAIAAYLLFGLGFIAFGLLNADWLLKSTSQVPLLGALLATSAAGNSLLPETFGIHPNQIAGTITLVLPLLAALSIEAVTSESFNKAARWAVILATLFAGLALLATQSRSAWVAIIGGLFVLLITWALTMKSSRVKRRLLTAAALLAILSFSIIVLLGPGRLQQVWLDPPQETAVGSLSTLSFRQELWPWAMEAINDFPFTGIGLGAFRAAARRLYPLAVDPAYDIAHAHNFFLQTTLDIGLPGFIAYGALLLVSLVLAFQAATRTSDLRAYSLGLFASLSAFHIFGLTDALALGSKSAVLLWAIFGILAALARLR